MCYAITEKESCAAPTISVVDSFLQKPPNHVFKFSSDLTTQLLDCEFEDEPASSNRAANTFIGIFLVLRKTGHKNQVSIYCFRISCVTGGLYAAPRLTAWLQPLGWARVQSSASLHGFALMARARSAQADQSAGENLCAMRKKAHVGFMFCNDQLEPPSAVMCTGKCDSSSKRAAEGIQPSSCFSAGCL